MVTCLSVDNGKVIRLEETGFTLELKLESEITQKPSGYILQTDFFFSGEKTQRIQTSSLWESLAA